MNICMKIGLGLKFSPTGNYRLANKAKFCKDNSKVKHSFFVLFFVCLIMGLSLEGGVLFK